MEHLYIPPDYKSELSLYDTQVAIKTVKDFFQKALAEQLYLLRVSAPLFVTPESGLNDNLNGVERPVTFGIREQNERPAEIVHSLAKWKRYALKQYGFHIGEGLYTDMSAIRRDEDTDNIHSIYVDQWDWEKILLKEDRNVDYLKDTVRKVYKALKKTEKYMAIQYDYIEEILPKDIFFITTQELADLYPDKSPKEREDLIAQEKGAVFLMEIGDKLADGKPHDGRAPDYDDWHLNGDILVWYPVLGHALELSSMGIRVDEDSLARQLKAAGCEERAELPFQKAILEKKLPYTVGGGIGQSRICMFYLRKAHIGEVQVCSTSEKPTSARSRCLSGRMRCVRRQRGTASICCKHFRFHIKQRISFSPMEKKSSVFYSLQPVSASLLPRSISAPNIRDNPVQSSALPGYIPVPRRVPLSFSDLDMAYAFSARNFSIFSLVGRDAMAPFSRTDREPLTLPYFTAYFSISAFS